MIAALDHAQIAEGPGGPAAMVPGQHHVRMNMYIAQARGGRFEIVESLGRDGSAGAPRGHAGPHRLRADDGAATQRRTHIERKEIAMLLATTQVEDFDRFLEIFSTKGAEKRKQHGSKGALVFRDPSEDDRVWVVFDWDEQGWQSFVSDPEVPPIMKEAGHKSRPQAAQFAGRVPRLTLRGLTSAAHRLTGQ